VTRYPPLNILNAYWALWLLAFVVPELLAVFNNARYTLSDTVWTIEGLNQTQPFDIAMWSNLHWMIAGVVWGLFLWLSLHIPFGLFG